MFSNTPITKFDTGGMRTKRIIFGVLAIVFFVWCIKGFWFGSDNVNVHPFRRSPEELSQEILLKDRQIAIIKAKLVRNAAKCGTNDDEDADLPIIYAVTPTHTRAVQKAELTRLSHTLLLVPRLHWVVIEDSQQKTDLVAELLGRSGVSYTHLNAATPINWKLKSKEPRWVKPRGVLQRNTALQWIRDNVTPTDGVLYFVDDDNTYDLQVFEEMRHVKRVGVWPVGLVGGLLVERPKINRLGKVEGWLTVWSPNRPFAIDMAGFAINLRLFLDTPNGKFSFEAEKGYQESELLKHFVSSLDDLEVKADNCSKVYVWHTRTEAVNLRQEDVLKKAGKARSDVGIEV